MKWVKLLPLFLLGILASCAGYSKYDMPSRTPSYIEVKNNGWSDIVVYEVTQNSTQKSRLVSVGSFHSERHVLPDLGTSDVYFLIHNIGGQDYVIQFPWSYQPNVRVELTVENNTALSTFTVHHLDN